MRDRFLVNKQEFWLVSESKHNGREGKKSGYNANSRTQINSNYTGASQNVAH
ncbi:MAG: hypothetical protein ACJAWV_000063 [Flammeovirgaceae bacterium]|jgi:hypothetical protein